MDPAFDKWWPADAPRAIESTTPALPPTLKVVPAEKKPEWTAVQVGERLRKVPADFGNLITEAQGELRQLADPAAGQPAARQRAEAHWQAWLRTWLNRVKLIEKELPPADACAKDPAKVPLCQGLEALLTRARDLPRAGAPAAARRELDTLKKDLGNLLAPEPEA